jgi:hypothetical protein
MTSWFFTSLDYPSHWIIALDELTCVPIPNLRWRVQSFVALFFFVSGIFLHRLILRGLVEICSSYMGHNNSQAHFAITTVNNDEPSFFSTVKYWAFGVDGICQTMDHLHDVVRSLFLCHRISFPRF